jgi:microcystin-dependent protein
MSSSSSSWPIAVTGYDSLRLLTRRVDRQARNASPISAADLLGPGMSSQAVHILDLNDEVATFNGFFYVSAGGQNAPVILDEDDEPILLSWIGTVIARQDGTGTQQMWNTDDPGSMYFRVRNYAPNPVDPDGPPIFGEWQRFATRSGFVEEDDLHPDVRDDIDQALEDGGNALHLAESLNKRYQQATPPTDPDSNGRVLVTNDTWFDSDDTNRPYRWNGSAWVDATQSWLISNPTTTFPNVVISPFGLVAYDASGVAVTTIDSSDGFLTTTGSIFAGADISGSTVTGGTVQTDADPDVGVKMNNLGFLAFDAAGDETVLISATDGSILLRGGLWAGGWLQTGDASDAHIEIGRPFFDSATIIWYDDTGAIDSFLAGGTGVLATTVEFQAPVFVGRGTIPVGGIVAWVISSIPSGWLKCDGSTFSSSTYPDLYALLGTNVLPDLRDRQPVGVGTEVALGGTEGRALGLRNPVAHSHITLGHRHDIADDGSHDHGGNTGDPSGTVDRAAGGVAAAGPNHTHPISNGGTHDHGGQTAIEDDTTGTNTAGYYGVNFIIRAR